MDKKDFISLILAFSIGCIMAWLLKPNPPQLPEKKPKLVYNQEETVKNCDQVSEARWDGPSQNVSYVRTLHSRYKLLGHVCSSWATFSAPAGQITALPLIDDGRGKLCVMGQCADVIHWEAN